MSGKKISAADTNSLYAAKDNCPFCNLDNARILKANSYALAIFDAFPVSPGHTLILPKRHISSFFDATQEEQTAMFELLSFRYREIRLIFPFPTLILENMLFLK